MVTGVIFESRWTRGGARDLAGDGESQPAVPESPDRGLRVSTAPADCAPVPLASSARCSCPHAGGNGSASASRDSGRRSSDAFGPRIAAPSTSRPADCRF
jgi:hypothetical protein